MMMSEFENLESACEMTAEGREGRVSRPSSACKEDERRRTLSTAERARDCRRPALDARKEGVEHALARQERVVGRLLLGRRTGRADRPDLGERVLRCLALELGLEDDVLSAREKGGRKSVSFCRLPQDMLQVAARRPCKRPCQRSG